MQYVRELTVKYLEDPTATAVSNGLEFLDDLPIGVGLPGEKAEMGIRFKEKGEGRSDIEMRALSGKVEYNGFEKIDQDKYEVRVRSSESSDGEAYMWIFEQDKQHHINNSLKIYLTPRNPF